MLVHCFSTTRGRFFLFLKPRLVLGHLKVIMSRTHKTSSLLFGIGAAIFTLTFGLQPAVGVHLQQFKVLIKCTDLWMGPYININKMTRKYKQRAQRSISYKPAFSGFHLFIIQCVLSLKGFLWLRIEAETAVALWFRLGSPCCALG